MDIGESTDRVEWIERTLRQAFDPTHLAIEDETALHAGHAGARGGGGHFRVVIVAEAFTGKTQVARQRNVYAALGSAMGPEIHALALTTLTPQEWARRR
jgi:BolA protein